MKSSFFQSKSEVLFFTLLGIAWLLAVFVIPGAIGTHGFFGNYFLTHTILKFGLIWVLMAHITISAMSICYHRAHTHQAVKLNKMVDYSMQIWLWFISSLSMLDWVAVHIYHHATSDTEKDPHSPKHKGFWHVFFFGAYDFTQAKSWPEVQKIRSRLKAGPLEKFIGENLYLAPILFVSAQIFCFGPLYGSILAILNFAITPLFAVGGVNAIAHWIGYQNYESKDNSKNIGFLFPLNWIIAGELDHNNHHRYPKSPSFAHRWFEFDIGFFYVRLLKWIGLAQITGVVPKYDPAEIEPAVDNLVKKPLSI
jgi:stearoyl-CoA desaturase (delta-9 desaturase)